MLNIVFMGTPAFAVPALEKIHELFNVLAVFTQPDRPAGRGMKLQAPEVKVKALELGLSVHQPQKLPGSPEEQILKQLKPDVIVVAAYAQILKKNILELPRLGCLNIHSSLLPRWRGAAPIQWSLLSQDKVTGITIMKMVEKLDAGSILLQSEIAIELRETATTLHDKLSVLGGELIARALKELESGKLQERTQDEARVTYASKLTKSMALLDLNQSAKELDAKVRALNPWPGTTFVLESGEMIKILETRPHEGIVSKEKGKLYEHAGMVCLGTKLGTLEIVKLQFQGKKPISAADFLNAQMKRG